MYMARDCADPDDYMMEHGSFFELELLRRCGDGGCGPPVAAFFWPLTTAAGSLTNKSA